MCGTVVKNVTVHGFEKGKTHNLKEEDNIKPWPRVWSCNRIYRTCKGSHKELGFSVPGVNRLCCLLA